MLAHCTNPADFIVKFNPDFCSERYNQFKTEELALRSGMIKLHELKFIYLDDTATDLIQAWLANASLYVCLTINKQLIKEISIELYKEIHMLNLSEVTLFFSKLKRGHYGVLYGRFDGMMICSAAREYRQQRGLILSRLPEDEQKQLM